MPKARYGAQRYELVNFTDDGEWVLRDPEGELLVFEESGAPQDRVEPQCELCGRYSVNVAPIPETRRWVCHDTDCHGVAQGGA
jgi:hypothetical protein